MTGAALKKHLIKIYGKEFHAAAAKESGKDISTIYRWCASEKVDTLAAAWITEKMAARKIAEPAQ